MKETISAFGRASWSREIPAVICGFADARHTAKPIVRRRDQEIRRYAASRYWELCTATASTDFSFALGATPGWALIIRLFSYLTGFSKRAWRKPGRPERSASD